MKLKRFTAEGYRNIDRCEISFADGVNLFVGGNAEGKTNIVEGIYLFSRGRSFRTSDDKDLVGFGKDGFRISIVYEDKDGEQMLEYALFGRSRQRKKNGYKLAGAFEMLGNFKAVLFFPDDLRLVKGEPEERRAFLNVAVSQYSTTYLSDYKRFKTALENRNALLKNASKGQYFDEGELVAWSEAMAEYSADVYLARKSYVRILEKYAKEHMTELSDGKETLELGYKSDIEGEFSDKESVKEEYRRVFLSRLEREKLAGTSLYGPQRDDLIIKISGNAARSFASQGQQRSVVLSLKLAEGEVIREIYGEYPVFLFDDVLSELDVKRREYVTNRIKKMQTVITSCEGTDALSRDANVILVKGGTYVPAYR